ncbi:MAG: hypothetical protein ACM3S1_08750 [Hyphomicrobiales bacterium]
MTQPENEDQLLERLRETTSGESSVRQLRRRYDLLRRDYEVLLDRLAELEERLAERPMEPATRQEPTPATAPERPVRNLLEQLTAPLAELREAYREAIQGLQAIVAGLDALTIGGFKGQRGSEPQAAPPPPPPDASAAPAGAPSEVQVEVRARGFGDLLDFQERLSALPGVARVSIRAIDSEQATFTVDLGPAG